MRGIWAGDEDLGDGSLQLLYEEYKRRCSFVKAIGSPSRVKLICSDVKKLLVEMQDDLSFLTSGAKLATDTYAKAIESGGSSEQAKMELAWNVIGFEDLVKKLTYLQADLNPVASGNHSVDMLSVKSELLSFLKGLYSKKRIVATHIMVFMISDELRNHKPYAVPVRFMPYRSITDEKLRQLELQLENAMRSRGMTVVGTWFIRDINIAPL